MRRWWRRQSIRLRLSIWYAGTLLVLLLMYGSGVWLFVRYSLSAELDHRLREDFEVAETMLERTADGRIRWRGRRHPEDDEADEQVRAEAWSRDGALLFRSEGIRRFAEALGKPRSGDTAFGRRSLPGGRNIRFLEAPHVIDGRPVIIRVIRSEDRLSRMLARLALIELLGLPLGVALAGLGGHTLARRLLAPVARMTERAGTITAERLHERLPVDNPDDELGHLAAVFNITFARLERSFAQLRRFTADASHELRTPLTGIRSVGEVALREPRDAAAYREVIGSMLEETDRLGQLVDSLLVITRADSGQAALHRERIDLGALAHGAADDLGVLAEEKEQSISVEAPEGVEVTADGRVLRHAVLNLVDNAVKYSPAGAPIRIVVGREGHGAVLEVIDRGPGIAAAHQPHVFERFYRVDRARSREEGGSGLGLAIARWAVEAHGGTIELHSEAGKGATFRITLPMD